MVISWNNNSSERTEVLYGEENAILRFLSKAYRIDSSNKEQKDEESPIINTTLLLGSFLMLLLLSLIVVPPISASHIALANTGKFSKNNGGGGGDKGNTDGSSSGSTSDTLTQEGATDNNNGGVNPTDISTKRIRDIEAGVDLADIEVIPSSVKAQEIYSNLIKSASAYVRRSLSYCKLSLSNINYK